MNPIVDLCAGRCDLMAEEQVAARDDALGNKNTAGALIRARQAQTAADCATSLRSLTEAEIAAVLPKGEHVAWLRYVTQPNNKTRIQLCDSDEPNAFRVYRHATPAAPVVLENVLGNAKRKLLKEIKVTLEYLVSGEFDAGKCSEIAKQEVVNINDYLRMGGWVSVTPATLPEELTEVLVLHYGKCRRGSWYTHNDGTVCWDIEGRTGHPHLVKPPFLWQPLPPLPEATP